MRMNTITTGYTTTSSDWGYQPVYNTPANPATYQSEPSFTFQSTSAFITPANASTAGLRNRPVLRSETNPLGGTPSGEEIGILPAKSPIGSPLALMAFAIIYIAFKALFKKRSFPRK